MKSLCLCVSVAKLCSLLPAGGELRGDLGHASPLEARGIERHLVGARLPVVALKGDAVGVAGLELVGVGVAGADDDRAPVVEGVVEREDGGLLPAVRRGR